MNIQRFYWLAVLIIMSAGCGGSDTKPNPETQMVSEIKDDSIAYSIVKLSPDRWQEYKDLRLFAVNESPLSVVKNPEEMQAIKENSWQSMLKRAFDEKQMFLYFAQIDNKIVGVSGAMIDEFAKMRHRALVISIYVLPEYRNKGIGKVLLETLFDKLEKKGVQQVRLFVETQNEEAINLYKDLGFKTVGLCEKYFCVDGVYYDQLMMSKELKKVA